MIVSVRETHSQLEQKQKQLHVLKTELCSTSSKTAELQAQVCGLVNAWCKF